MGVLIRCENVSRRFCSEALHFGNEVEDMTE